MEKEISKARTLGQIGAILSLLYFIPVVGWAFALAGMVLLYLSMEDLVRSTSYEGAEKRLLTAVIIEIVSWVAFIVVFFLGLVAIRRAMVSPAPGNACYGEGGPYLELPFFGLVCMAELPNWGVILMSLAIPYVLNIIAGLMYRDAFSQVGDLTGVSEFHTAGNLIMWGRILSIVLVGFIVDFVGRVVLSVSFFSMPESLPLPGAKPGDSHVNNSENDGV
ncbi:MAG TPA: DUF996 domain-containing protein [Coprothermobacter sp.]|nr:DUF996 domain-containing protein [Coprothermobacter sp.]